MKEKFTTLQQYLEYLQSRGKYSFMRNEVMASLGITGNAFKKAAHRLMLKGKLNRVRGDFYTVVPPEYHASGSLPASWFIDKFMEYLEQPYYGGLLTAASLYGAAHQQPMIFQVITNKQTRPITSGQVRIEFIRKKVIHSHFYQTVKTPTGMMKTSTPEMTAFDLVRYMNVAGQISNVATVLSELIDQLHPEKLAMLVEKNDVEIATAQRLGYLLEMLKLTIDLKPLEKALKGKKLIQRLLVLGGEQFVIEHNQRWHILINELVEPDEV